MDSMDSFGDYEAAMARKRLAEHNDGEPTTSHLLAHGQNRNQYMGSEPTSWQETHDCPCLHLDHACVGNDCDTCRGFNHANWPTMPKPQQHVHERGEFTGNDHSGRPWYRCASCPKEETVMWWYGWEQRGKVEKGARDATA